MRVGEQEGVSDAKDDALCDQNLPVPGSKADTYKGREADDGARDHEPSRVTRVKNGTKSYPTKEEQKELMGSDQ